ncbi:amino acid adenylation domain-containing protein [Saccharopolyspora shandongensis]|uniref:Amino acid adenylation domain-containing protein n=1 Tax=Saccharopolyspora shandongensis TaxID=418495 RepID=A0A1H3BEJ5_9PSEU|nr:non-ribosomal peptide synthetase [Saccharopolyspora shandongensis]SDX40347.1 amino acid adenylation domain-containing protein [Saccharopolyspora shandongensis]
MNGASRPPGTPLTHELIAGQAAATPHAVALVDDEREVSYQDLERRANQLAHLLLERGAGAEHPVAVRLRRSTKLVIALLAVWKAGAAYAPLDPDHPRSWTAAVLAETGASIVLTDSADTFDGVDSVVLDDVLEVLDDRAETAPEVQVSGSHPAYVLFTSGSTGKPKGVVVSHAGFGNQLRWRVANHRLSPRDRVLQKTPLTFDAAGWEIFAPLLSGGTAVLAPVGAERNPTALLNALAHHRITVLQVVPSVLRALVAEPGWERCTSLRVLSSGGEPLHAELGQQFLRAVEPGAGEVEVWNTYGPSECAIDVTAHRFDPLQRSGPVSIGEPIDGMRAVVCDPAGEPVPPGEAGELHIGGVGVGHGYLGRPELTAESFVPDPDGPPGARWYRTGDLARRRADGNLEYLGRIDHQVKVNGVRVEPGEVETALAAHPGVLEAAVTSFTAANGATRLVAYVRRRGTAAVDDARAFLAERLPDTHVPPAFVEVAEFPTTRSGKIDRRALPAPDSVPTEAPSTDAQRLVARVWQDLLQVDQVGAHDEFFRLGGSSLQFTRLANQLRVATGKDIPLAALLRATTVEAQARLIAPSATDAPVRPVPRGGALPVSFGQRRLWLLDRINPGAREWVSGLFLRVPARSNEQLIRSVLDALVARHEALRTRFAIVGDEPVQYVDPPRRVELRVHRGRRDQMPDVLEQETARGFDLESGPLIRAVLFRGPDGETRDDPLVVLMHHIVCDGWSSAVLEREFYEIFSGGLTKLPALEVQYADYAAWQRERLTEELLEDELAHWRTALAGVEPLTPRPDHPRPAVRDARGAVVGFTIPPEVAEALGELGRRHGATPFMTLLTAFATLLARHGSQWDVPVGVPTAGRDRPELEGVVGFFLNSLVLRCRLDADITFEQALEQVRAACVDAFEHQELPFERLVAELVPERDLSRTPLYQVAFDFHGDELTGAPEDSAELDTLIRASQVAKTDLTLYLRRQPDGSMVGLLEYATALFDQSTIARFGKHFLELLGAVVADPRARLGALEFLPEDERHELSSWHHHDAPPVAASVLDDFERQVAVSGDAVALNAGEASMSFAELDARANQLARRLRAAGAGPESVVGVLLERGVDLPVALLAVWKAGAAYLPLDPDFPVERAGFALADAGARILVTQREHQRRAIEAFDGELVLVDSVRAEDPAPLARAADLDQLAYVIYTSGSTGEPKGVQISHRGLANHVRWAVAELAGRGAGGAALFSSVAFDLVVPNLWAPLLAGQPLHLLPPDLDLAELGRHLLAAAPLSFLKLTPGHLEILSHQVSPAQMRQLAEVVVVAGEALPPRLAEQWTTALGAGRLINEYGPTEASVGTCTFPVATPVGGDSVPIGRPLPGMSMYVLDDSLRPAPIGVVGELYVGGTGVARGYANRPELTAERFIPDPFGPPGARLYRTGDLARVLAGGAVDFAGRRDEQVKIRGYRVELGEIAAVLDAHPGVRDAVVIAGEDVSGNTTALAYCVLSSADLKPEDLLAHCAARLPSYMVPSAVTPIDSIPLTANGKLDRAALPAVGGSGAELVAPRGIVEERIAEIFTKLLGVPTGAHTGFFGNGGNSILAIRLIAAIQSEFEVDLPIRAAFEGDTVAELAAAVEARIRAEVDQMSEEELRATDLPG